MKNNRHIKIEKELNALEAELLKNLLEELPTAAENGADLFRLDRWSRNPTLISNYIEKSKTSISLRETLAMDTKRSIGALYLLAHEECSDENNEHRRGPKRLAGWLLNELNN